ncbi:MAG: aspartate aminotransferase family protein, partial [Pirellulales bacterium]|nr:aspartate aminotransferase family protein [Pirellulales bacterium]
MNPPDSSDTCTHADALRSDRRVAEAKRLIAEAVAEHSSSLTGVADADPNLAGQYQAMLERL